MGDSECENDLIRRAVGGDEVALGLLLKGIHGRLCAHVAWRIPARLRGVLDAHDIVQDAYIRVFLHINDFQPRGDDSFYRWVATIAIRKLRDAVTAARARKRNPRNMKRFWGRSGATWRT